MYFVVTGGCVFGGRAQVLWYCLRIRAVAVLS